MKKILILLFVAFEMPLAFAFYDPMIPNPNPTWSDVHEAENCAFEHGQRAAEHMSDSDSNRCIAEMEAASRARNDAMQMRMEIDDRERRERMAREEEFRRQQDFVIDFRNSQPQIQDDSQYIVFEDVPCRRPNNRTGVPNMNAPRGTCMYCGAHLLGKQRCCNRCKLEYHYQGK